MSRLLVLHGVSRDSKRLHPVSESSDEVRIVFLKDEGREKVEVSERVEEERGEGVEEAGTFSTSRKEGYSNVVGQGLIGVTNSSVVFN